MRWPSFLQRKNPPAAAAPRTGDASATVQQARSRARRRLIGAVVLLGVGIVGFPLIFETQPRPIPVDITIEIPRKENAPPLAPPPRASGRALPADAGADEPPGSESAPAGPPAVDDTAAAATPPPAAARATPTAAEPAPAPAPSAHQPAAVPAVAAVPAPAPAPAPAPPPEPARAPTAASAPAAARYVLQVGAYAEEATVRQVRARIERLGLKTYTQAVDTAAGKRTRVRIGPFETREAAAAAGKKLEAAGLPFNLLTL
jgi:DedD protein